MSRSARPLAVAGLAQLSTCDWPGQLAATVFCQGCPWSCPYCHNPGLIPPGRPGSRSWGEILDWLRGRVGLLDAVVFSGGEPTLQPSLPHAVEAVRELGFAIGLHTSGALPRRLDALLPVVDWVGLDIKAPSSHYQAVTGSGVGGQRAFASLEYVIDSGVDYEVRTTIDPDLLGPAALDRLVEELSQAGVRAFVAQRLLRRDPVTQAMVAGPALPAAFLSACAERFPAFAYRTGH